MGLTDKMVPEVYQVFWSGMAAGEFITDAARAGGTYRRQGARWLVEAGGVRPRRGRDLKGRCLTLIEREEIALARAGGESMRDIARALGRSPSTISRELSRNADGQGRYRGTVHASAYERASRPKPAKLATNLRLRAKVEADLAKKYSPEQIAGRLKVEFPDQPEMQVSTETIYQSLYVQSRGALKRELTRCLRTGWAVRKPCRKPGQRKNRIPNMINIAERPAEAADRAVPGHWKRPDHRNQEPVRGRHPGRAQHELHDAAASTRLHPREGPDALIAKIKTLPEVLRASLTWDQGTEMGKWEQVAVDADIDIYFCDPHAPWQRATNENTNGLLRQYFPKGSNLSVHTAADLDWVAAELNDRPRKRLGYRKPIEQLGELFQPS